MAKTYGYCRISTRDQSIDRQIRNILAADPDAIILDEAYTGTTMHRPKWEKLATDKINKETGKVTRKALAQPGDTIIFDSVSRMSRDADEGVKAYMELYNKGVNLVFLKEPQIDTDTYKEALERQISVDSTGDNDTDELVQAITAAVNKYMLRLAERQIRLAFGQAQKEVQDLRQRTKEGMETARLNGKQIGQLEGAKLHSKVGDKAKAVIAAHSKAFGGNLSDNECQILIGCSRNTYYKYKSDLKSLYDLWSSETNEPESEEWRENLDEVEQTIVDKWDDAFPL